MVESIPGIYMEAGIKNINFPTNHMMINYFRKKYKCSLNL